MKKIVKCPLCGKLHQTRGKHYFSCCQMAWEIEKCQVTSYDDVRYTVPPKSSKDKKYIRIVDKRGKELSKDEIERLIRESLRGALDESEKRKPRAEKLVVEPPEPSDEDLIY